MESDTQERQEFHCFHITISLLGWSASATVKSIVVSKFISRREQFVKNFVNDLPAPRVRLLSY
jgi:hypothetical protein